MDEVKKHPGGRPTKYSEEYATQEFIDKYIKFRKDSNLLVSLCGLAVYLNVCEDTLQEWKHVHPTFSVALGIIKQNSKDMLVSKGLDSTYNSTIAKLVLSANHGLSEKIEHYHDVSFSQVLSKATKKGEKDD